MKQSNSDLLAVNISSILLLKCTRLNPDEMAFYFGLYLYSSKSHPAHPVNGLSTAYRKPNHRQVASLFYRGYACLFGWRSHLRDLRMVCKISSKEDLGDLEITSRRLHHKSVSKKVINKNGGCKLLKTRASIPMHRKKDLIKKDQGESLETGRTTGACSSSMNQSPKPKTIHRDCTDSDSGSSSW